MQPDFLLDQSRPREVDLAPSRYGALAQTAPIDARRAPFDGFTRGLHWATVLLVLAVFTSGTLHALAEVRESDFTPILLQIHRSIGVTIWVVTALRLTWRLTHASLPPFPTQMTTLHRGAVKLSEYGLYALLLGQPATGLLMTLFGGRPFALLLWRVPAVLVPDQTLRAAFHLLHELGAWTLAVLAVSHAAAALFHHFVLRDDVLECIAPVMQRARSEQELSSGPIVPTRNAFGK